ncbi:MAG TPA: hypothetical protein VGU20_03105 [Stellaceae bacterium]|nr:hypothetical protein [Stellaceae bacterium]
MRILGHWREICGDREFPMRSEITAERLGADWSHCLLIAVDAEPERSSFLYVGPSLMVPDSPSLVGSPVAACSRENILGLATAYLGTVLQRRVPVSMSGAGAHLGAPILYRSILLPLSSDGHQIDGLLGAANFRYVRTSEEEDSG